MCGIAGIYDTAGRPVDRDLVERMSRTIAHRGPDGASVFVKCHVGFGHRRLAIIDLSDAAAQPMSNEDGSVVVVYNGEIYNHAALRRQLEAAGHRFVSHCDTEVLVHGFEEWGPDIVHRLNGMFAFAIWDERADRLVMGRDRYGIKPLYYRVSHGRVTFGSEVKALLAADDQPVSVDCRALAEYFTFQNVFSDRTLFEGVRLLPPGHLAEARPGWDTVETRRWWDFRFSPDRIGLEEASETVRLLMERAVSRQLMSDVPLGSYLSGGMDSGSIVALASREIPHLMTFTGGFDLTLASGLEQNFDERAQAEQLASLFGTDHYEMVMHPGSMERVLAQLVWHLEDLRVGMSYQNYYIAHLASRFVKVVLSGGGGDEMFAGYPWRYLPLMSCDSREEFDKASYATWQRLVPHDEHRDFFLDALLSELGDYSPFEVFKDTVENAPGSDGVWSPEVALDREMYLEAKTFLHGLLVVEDKISSAHALEARVPFLDNELVDFATTLPAHLRFDYTGALGAVDSAGAVQSSDGKVVLRRAMRGIVPDTVLAAKKQGFSVPDGSWYRSGSAEFVRGIVLSERALDRGYFRPAYIERVLEEHAQGVRNHRLLIWSLLCFEMWNRLFVDGESELV